MSFFGTCPSIPLAMSTSEVSTLDLKQVPSARIKVSSNGNGQICVFDPPVSLHMVPPEAAQAATLHAQGVSPNLREEHTK